MKNKFMEIEIREVTGKKELKAFVKFNIELYKDSPYHVPGLIQDELTTLSSKKNPAFEFCEAKYFLAYKDGKIAGRIAGIINHRSNEVWKQQHARFGFIDFIDDEEVSEKLFLAVESWAKSKGMTAMHGPLGFTDLDHEGLLIEGFDRLATMATAYSYPYYYRHLERLGYAKDQDWYEYRITAPAQVPEKYARVAEIARKRHGLKVIKFRKTKDIWPYAYKLFALWNKAYAPLYAYSPLSDRQIKFYIKMYIPMLRLELISLIVREIDDEVVGLGICIPNLSIPLRKARGKLFPFGFLYLLKTLYSKKIKEMDMMMIGVDPDYQNKGVNALIFSDMITSMIKLGVENCESNPELEVNNKIQSHWEYFDAYVHKKRRAYIKALIN
jgi:GNAT superfamily N-acetyltransferase